MSDDPELLAALRQQEQQEQRSASPSTAFVSAYSSSPSRHPAFPERYTEEDALRTFIRRWAIDPFSNINAGRKEEEEIVGGEIIHTARRWTVDPINHINEGRKEEEEVIGGEVKFTVKGWTVDRVREMNKGRKKEEEWKGELREYGEKKREGWEGFREGVREEEKMFRAGYNNKLWRPRGAIRDYDEVEWRDARTGRRIRTTVINSQSRRARPPPEGEDDEVYRRPVYQHPPATRRRPPPMEEERVYRRPLQPRPAPAPRRRPEESHNRPAAPPRNRPEEMVNRRSQPPVAVTGPRPGRRPAGRHPAIVPVNRNLNE